MVEFPLPVLLAISRPIVWPICSIRVWPKEYLRHRLLYVDEHRHRNEIVGEWQVTTIVTWGLDGKVEYAFEGSVFIAGAAVQWLRDGLHLIDQSKDSEYFALKAQRWNRWYVVPAFAGWAHLIGICMPVWRHLRLNTRYGQKTISFEQHWNLWPIKPKMFCWRWRKWFRFENFILRSWWWRLGQ